MIKNIYRISLRTFIIILVLIITSSAFLSAEDVQKQNEIKRDISIAVLKGPSGFAAAKLLGDNFQPGFGVHVNYLIMSSPLEVVAKMTSGEVDGAFLPVNLAAKLYTKGPGYKLAAVSGLGSLYMVSSDDTISTWKDLKNKTIYLTGKGATPDYLLRYLLMENGLDPERDVTLNFSAQAPQIAQLMIAGRIDTAFIPQPFVLQVETKAKPARTVLDPQKELLKIRGGDKAYPFTAFVISPALVEENYEAASALTNALGHSIDWTLRNPRKAAKFIEDAGIMSASIAEDSIAVSGIEFIPALEAKADIENFLNMMMNLDPISVGGSLPNEGFYFQK